MKTKSKPQINFSPSTRGVLYGVLIWTKDGKKITAHEARQHFDKGNCHFTIPAWQEMTAVIAAENFEKAE